MIREICLIFTTIYLNALVSLLRMIFFKIVNYSEKKVIFDVYKTRCTSSTNEEDYLYLKLRIAPDNKLLIGSFKRV